MSVLTIIKIIMCFIEAGLIAFMAVQLLDVLGIYDDFKQWIVDRLDDLRRKLEEYTKK